MFGFAIIGLVIVAVVFVAGVYVIGKQLRKLQWINAAEQVTSTLSKSEQQPSVEPKKNEQKPTD